MKLKLLKNLTILFLVISVALCQALSPDWVDYDDEDDAYDTYSASPKRELVEVPGLAVSSVDVVQNVLPGGYGSYGGGRGGNLPNPYGMSPPSPRAGTPSPPPTPTPPAAAVTASYSTSATVPGVKSTATLSSYGTVADFNDVERTRFVTTLQSNIFSLLKTLANVTIDSVTPGSITVSNTIAFTGSDSTQASASAAALVTALKSGDTSVFGTSFGTVAVSGVTAANTTNPTTTSGASSTQWKLLPIFVAVVAVATMMLIGTSL